MLSFSPTLRVSPALASATLCGIAYVYTDEHGRELQLPFAPDAQGARDTAVRVMFTERATILARDIRRKSCDIAAWISLAHDAREILGEHKAPKAPRPERPTHVVNAKGQTVTIEEMAANVAKNTQAILPPKVRSRVPKRFQPDTSTPEPTRRPLGVMPGSPAWRAWHEPKFTRHTPEDAARIFESNNCPGREQAPATPLGHDVIKCEPGRAKNVPGEPRKNSRPDPLNVGRLLVRSL